MNKGLKEKEVDIKPDNIDMILKSIGLAMLFSWLIWLTISCMLC